MHQHIIKTFLSFLSQESPYVPTMGFIVFPLDETVTGPCQATDYSKETCFLWRLINEPINSKSTAMDASIIAIIYRHLLCVNYLFGIGPVGSTKQGGKSSVALKKKENWSCRT